MINKTNNIEPLTQFTNSAVYTISFICTTSITINALACVCSHIFEIMQLKFIDTSKEKSKHTST